MSSTPFHTHRTVIIIIITLLSADNNSHLAAVDNEAISAMTIQDGGVRGRTIGGGGRLDTGGGDRQRGQPRVDPGITFTPAKAADSMTALMESASRIRIFMVH